MRQLHTGFGEQRVRSGQAKCFQVLTNRQDDEKSYEADRFYTARAFDCVGMRWDFIAPIDTGFFKRRFEGTGETNELFE